MTFIERAARGEISGDLYEALIGEIEQWYAAEGTRPGTLEAFLGLSGTEYMRCVASREAVQDIVAERRAVAYLSEM